MKHKILVLTILLQLLPYFGVAQTREQWLELIGKMEEGKQEAIKEFGKESIPYWYVVNKIAFCYLSMSEYKTAEPLCHESYAYYTKYWGRDAKGYEDAVNNICRLYRETGKYYKILPYLNERLAIYNNSPIDKSYVLSDFGTYYQEMGEYNKAENYFYES